MHFQLDAETATYRDGVRAHLQDVLTPEFEERALPSGVAHDDEFAKGLVEKGYFAPGWPVEFGGQNRNAWDDQVVKEELMRFDAPMYLSETTRMVASIIREVGTPALKDRILAGAMNGDITIALGFTEPECGSDVAAAATKAVRDGEDWVINGSKMFTTNAHIADFVFLLARTSPDKPKHKGLTMFLVPRDSDGFAAQAVWTLSGERTNITFYSDVRIGDEWRIGEVDGGWQVLGLSLRDEHASGWGPHLSGCWTMPNTGPLPPRPTMAHYPSRMPTSGAGSPGLRWRPRSRCCCSGGACGCSNRATCQWPRGRCPRSSALKRSNVPARTWWNSSALTAYAAISSRLLPSTGGSTTHYGSRWAPRSTRVPAKSSAPSSRSVGSAYPVSF